MPIVDHATRLITCKLVYYGPGRSGKTTNLTYLHGALPGGQVGSPADVGNTIENLWNNSGASAIELYEERIWEANGAALGGAVYPTYTIGTWNTELHDRRRTTYGVLGDPAPTTYTFTLGAPVLQPPNNFELDAYVDPRRPIKQVPPASACLNGFLPCLKVYP